jgi:hypothetical protein
MILQRNGHLVDKGILPLFFYTIYPSDPNLSFERALILVYDLSPEINRQGYTTASSGIHSRVLLFFFFSSLSFFSFYYKITLSLSCRSKISMCQINISISHADFSGGNLEITPC